jgi:hypothetical protein
MPWAVAPLRLGRSWVVAPDAATLRARWDRLVRAEPAEREALFEPTRSRTLRSAVAQLPGHPAPAGRLLSEAGPCPEPVRVAAGGPLDRQWLIPDHRVIDAARPELWRVADHSHQLYVLDHPDGLGYTALLPAGLPGRIRPLYRRPGGLDPNLAPGLLDHLGRRLGLPVTPEDVLAWTAVSGTREVLLPADATLWTEGVVLGRQVLWLHTYGSRCGSGQPRMPGGQRPYVRAAVPDVVDAVAHDPGEQALRLGSGVVSPVPLAAAEVAEEWCGRRLGVPWPRSHTSELLELVTVAALLHGLAGPVEALRARVSGAALIDADELRMAGVLPAPGSARLPASVLDAPEEGPDGQFALL